MFVRVFMGDFTIYVLHSTTVKLRLKILSNFSIDLECRRFFLDDENRPPPPRFFLHNFLKFQNIHSFFYD